MAEHRTYKMPSVTWYKLKIHVCIVWAEDQRIYGQRSREDCCASLSEPLTYLIDEYLKANLDGWMILLLAVDPPYQRRGIATAMFKKMTSQVARNTVNDLSFRT